MKKHVAVLVVGHAQWGKSKTLKELTNGNIRIRRFLIGARSFKIRRMSNDDRADSYIKFVERLPAVPTDDLLITLCPDFDREEEKFTKRALDRLRKTHRLFFFVLKYSFQGDREITETEIRTLQRYGTVEVYAKRSQEAAKRAAKLKTFISSIA